MTGQPTAETEAEEDRGPRESAEGEADGPEGQRAAEEGTADLLGVFEEALKEENQPHARTAREDAGYVREDVLADETETVDDPDDEFARLARAAEEMSLEDNAGEILEQRMAGGARPKRAPSAPEAETKPGLTLEEAVQRISPEAREVLEKTLKGSFREVRAYRKK